MSKGKYKSNINRVQEVEHVEVFSYITAFRSGNNNHVNDGIERKEIPAIPGIKPNRTYTITVSGDSMSPLLLHGDTVLIDTGINQVKSGDIIAIYLNGDYLVKVYDPGSLCLYLSSINQSYEPIRVYDEDECVILGKAIKIIRDI
jgi:phage repressor protein C with HTH and peptisase S24 domain